MTNTWLATKTLLATLALGTAVILAGPASAETYKVTLDGKSEVPANTSTGTGTADVDYDAASKKLTWTLTYSGLTGPATAAHFHGAMKRTPLEQMLAGTQSNPSIPTPMARALMARSTWSATFGNMSSSYRFPARRLWRIFASSWIRRHARTSRGTRYAVNPSAILWGKA